VVARRHCWWVFHLGKLRVLARLDSAEARLHVAYRVHGPWELGGLRCYSTTVIGSTSVAHIMHALNPRANPPLGPLCSALLALYDNNNNNNNDR
jgi:hypothetical protein